MTRDDERAHSGDGSIGKCGGNGIVRRFRLFVCIEQQCVTVAGEDTRNPD